MPINLITEDTAHVGDFGYPVTLDTKVDITGATALKILVVKPDEDSTEVEWTGAAAYLTTKIRYTLASTDLDIRGTYLLQAYALNGTTWQRTGDVFKLKVLGRGEEA